MVSVTVKNGEPFEKALRRFKKKWEKAGILRDVRSRQYYLKPSEEKKIARSKKKRGAPRPASRY
jgi:small subunit ribosomal protein S21|tara:strand:+ start:798 stop:989 length:192 start_codon:yes stop_codon:yes gene_type:complete